MFINGGRVRGPEEDRVFGLSSWRVCWGKVKRTYIFFPFFFEFVHSTGQLSTHRGWVGLSIGTVTLE